MPEALGLTSYYKSSTAARQHISVTDGHTYSDAYLYDAGTRSWGAQGLTLSTGAKAEFETFIDYLFMVNYEDDIHSFDGTTWSTSTNVTNAPRAKYIKEFNARLYVANCDSGSVAYNSRVYFSSFPSAAGAITWDTTNDWFDVGRDDGDVIKGLGLNANRLLIFKLDSMYRYDGNTLYEVQGSPGTVNQRTVQDVRGMTIYLHNSGVWSYDGVMSTLISRPIQEYIDGIGAQTIVNACSYVKGDKYRVYVGGITNTEYDISLTNAYLEWDFATKRWTVGTMNDKVVIYNAYFEDDTEIIYDDTAVTYSDPDVQYDGYESAEPVVFFASADAEIMKDESGYDDDGSAVEMRVTTPKLYGDDPDEYKLYQRVAVQSRNGMATTVRYKVDQEDWEELGLLTEEFVQFDFRPGWARGRAIQLQFTDSSTGWPVTIEGFTIYYTKEGLD